MPGVHTDSSRRSSACESPPAPAPSDAGTAFCCDPGQGKSTYPRETRVPRRYRADSRRSWSDAESPDAYLDTRLVGGRLQLDLEPLLSGTNSMLPRVDARPKQTEDEVDNQ